MKTITLTEAFDILKAAPAVMMGGYPARLFVAKDRLFARVNVHDEISFEFTEVDNNRIAPHINGAVLTLIDTDHIVRKLTILALAKLTD